MWFTIPVSPPILRSAKAVLAGVAVGAAIAMAPGPASAIWFSATYSAKLEEGIGTEKTASLSVTTQATDWYACTGSTCQIVMQDSVVGWTINDGSSAFDYAFTRHNGGAYCAGVLVKLPVVAGPNNSGLKYLPFAPAGCQITLSHELSIESGLCEISGAPVGASCDAAPPSNGPHIKTALTPPSNSASYFIYRY
jgi:hypothetical protein